MSDEIQSPRHPKVADALERFPKARRAGPARRLLTALSLGLVVVLLDVSIVNVAFDQIRGLMEMASPGCNRVGSTATPWPLPGCCDRGALGDRFGAPALSAAQASPCSTSRRWAAAGPVRPGADRGAGAHGLGAALLVPCSLTLLIHAYHDPHERARAIGIWALGGMAMVAGPVVGGC